MATKDEKAIVDVGKAMVEAGKKYGRYPIKL